MKIFFKCSLFILLSLFTIDCQIFDYELEYKSEDQLKNLFEESVCEIQLTSNETANNQLLTLLNANEQSFNDNLENISSVVRNFSSSPAFKVQSEMNNNFTERYDIFDNKIYSTTENEKQLRVYEDLKTLKTTDSIVQETNITKVIIAVPPIASTLMEEINSKSKSINSTILLKNYTNDFDSVSENFTKFETTFSPIISTDYSEKNIERIVNSSFSTVSSQETVLSSNFSSTTSRSFGEYSQTHSKIVTEPSSSDSTFEINSSLFSTRSSREKQFIAELSTFKPSVNMNLTKSTNTFIFEVSPLSSTTVKSLNTENIALIRSATSLKPVTHSFLKTSQNVINRTHSTEVSTENHLIHENLEHQIDTHNESLAEELHNETNSEIATHQTTDSATDFIYAENDSTLDSSFAEHHEHETITEHVSQRATKKPYLVWNRNWFGAVIHNNNPLNPVMIRLHGTNVSYYSTYGSGIGRVSETLRHNETYLRFPPNIRVSFTSTNGSVYFIRKDKYCVRKNWLFNGTICSKWRPLKKLLGCDRFKYGPLESQLCKNPIIDSATLAPNGLVYLFAGQRYWQLKLLSLNRGAIYGGKLSANLWKNFQSDSRMSVVYILEGKRKGYLYQWVGMKWWSWNRREKLWINGKHWNDKNFGRKGYRVPKFLLKFVMKDFDKTNYR